MLSCLGLQAVAGLFSDDQISTSGPLTARVSEAWVERATHWHTGPGKWVLLALLVLHLGSIYWYQRVRRIDLIRPMVDGNQVVDHAARESTDSGASRLLGAGLFLLCAAGVGLLVTNGSP
jgi:cytochrome b